MGSREFERYDPIYFKMLIDRRFRHLNALGEVNGLFQQLCETSASTDPKKINLLGPLPEGMKDELIEIFKPRFGDSIEYEEYLHGLRYLSTAFIARDREIQDYASQKVKSMLEAVDPTLPGRIDMLRESSGNSEGHDIAATSENVCDNLSLFRSRSVDTESTERMASQRLFVPDRFLDSYVDVCFEDLFTEEFGTVSQHWSEITLQLRKKYGFMWEYFGVDGVVKRF